MNNLKEKLTSLASDQTSDWKPGTRHRCENKEWLKKSADIGIFVLESLKAQNLSQKDLAEKLNISPQQISQIVEGQENLTLETITKLEKTLGIQFSITILSETISSLMIQALKRPDVWIKTTLKREPLFILILLSDLLSIIFLIICIMSRFS